MALSDEDLGFIKALLAFVHHDAYLRYRAVLHLLAERTGRPSEIVETEAKEWIERNVDRLQREATDDLEAFVQRLGYRPSWWFEP